MRFWWLRTMLFALALSAGALGSRPVLAQDRGEDEESSSSQDEVGNNDGPRARDRRGGDDRGGPGGGRGWGGEGGGGWDGPGGGFGPGGGGFGPGGGGWGGGGGGRGGRGGRGGGWGGGGGGGWGGGGGGFNPAAIFARQDRNGDGQISLDELDDRGREMMRRMAQNAGLSADGPWSVEELGTSVQERFRNGGRGRNEEDRDGSNRGSNEQDQDAKAASATPLVPGFGVTSETKRAAVPGFGVAVVVARTGGPSGASSESARPTPSPSRPVPAPAATTTSSSPPSSATSSAARTSAPGGDSKSRAQEMLGRYDTNKDGKLQEDEFKEMWGNPKAADTDGDNVITLDELAARVSASRGGGGGGGGGQQPAPASTGESRREDSGSRNRDDDDRGGDAPKGRKSYRFLTARERLPGGLPDWFAKADKDGDGQVMMAEYATRWSNADAERFARVDEDGDGVITPDEALSGGGSRDR